MGEDLRDEAKRIVGNLLGDPDAHVRYGWAVDEVHAALCAAAADAAREATERERERIAAQAEKEAAGWDQWARAGGGAKGIHSKNALLQFAAALHAEPDAGKGEA